MNAPLEILARLEELRAAVRAERISWGEITELQGLADHIDPGDTELLEAAGVPEFGGGEDLRSRFAEPVKNPLRLRIILDSQDAADCPDTPFTLNVYTDDPDGTQSRITWELDDGSSCMVGSDIPTMLRALADEIENGTVTR